MNTLLKIFGGIFLVLVSVICVIAAIYIPKGFKLQQDAGAYIRTNVPLIVENWNSEEVIKRAAPEFLVPAVQEGLPKVFEYLSHLGKLKKMEPPKGQVTVADFQLVFGENRINAGNIQNKPINGIWAEFDADAQFDAGPAKIKVIIVRKGETWKVMGFYVNPLNSIQSGG